MSTLYSHWTTLPEVCPAWVDVGQLKTVITVNMVYLHGSNKWDINCWP